MTSRARRDELPGRRDDGAEGDAGEAGCLGFVTGLPVVWIAMAGGAAMNPPWVLGLGLPLVYLVLAARPIRALPAKRRLAWALLPVGIVAGFPGGTAFS